MTDGESPAVDERGLKHPIANEYEAKQNIEKPGDPRPLHTYAIQIHIDAGLPLPDGCVMRGQTLTIRLCRFNFLHKIMRRTSFYSEKVSKFAK